MEEIQLYLESKDIRATYNLISISFRVYNCSFCIYYYGMSLDDFKKAVNKEYLRDLKEQADCYKYMVEKLNKEIENFTPIFN